MPLGYLSVPPADVNIGKEGAGYFEICSPSFSLLTRAATCYNPPCSLDKSHPNRKSIPRTMRRRFTARKERLGRQSKKTNRKKKNRLLPLRREPLLQKISPERTSNEKKVHFCKATRYDVLVKPLSVVRARLR